MNPALSFGAAADLYNRVRPGYPVEALRWILGQAPSDVVDLGAGTGILARRLHALGHRVTAVEPDAGMRAELTAAGPPEVVEGSAEAIGLPDASVDAVVAGQAYHWFATEAAHAEIARVLRPGGVFGPLWNLRDERVEWLAELSKLVDPVRHPADCQAYRGSLPADAFGPRFRPLERAEFHHSVTHTPETLLALVRSRSYYLTSDEAGRAGIDASVRSLLSSHPDVRGRDEFELPYRTVAYRASTVPLEDHP